MYGIVNVPGAFAVERKKKEEALLVRVESLEKTLGGQEKIPGTVPPTAQVPAQVGQIYINIVTGEEWKCVETGGGGTLWEKQERDENQSGLTEELTARIASLEKTLGGQEKIPGTAPPTAQVPARVGQIYINITTGEEWKCVAIDGGGSSWEKQKNSTVGLTAADVGARPDTWTPTASEVGAVPESARGSANGVASLDGSGKVPASQLPSLAPFGVGTGAPADKTKLWIDTTPNTGGLKYWNGSAWVHVPVAYT